MLHSPFARVDEELDVIELSGGWDHSEFLSNRCDHRRASFLVGFKRASITTRNISSFSPTAES